MHRLCDCTFSKSLKRLENLTDHSLQKLSHTAPTERERERERERARELSCLVMWKTKSLVYGKDSDSDWCRGGQHSICLKLKSDELSMSVGCSCIKITSAATQTVCNNSHSQPWHQSAAPESYITLLPPLKPLTCNLHILSHHHYRLYLRLHPPSL